ncbi:NAD(P)-binding protein [Sphingomonas sp. BIUV-7]|uniref:NAD(P)-binding protein n=1 Tax=Sphingomonas natans TaxID=3063330 RepID=A0ABT8Y9C7_9SPHN|nr:NAD(P)-binding protein [Sphingomonas sp. BIUV-7]MDO6414582.1 NAD(P)-binding protein [Sphingomonas sp. BIUV-7]
MRPDAGTVAGEAPLHSSTADAPFNQVLAGLTPRLDSAGESDAAIDAAVQSAGLMPLLMAVVHMTGSLAILDEAGPTARPLHSTDMNGGIAPETAAALREHAARAIRAWRDAGCPPAYQPTADELARMFDTLAGATLDPRYRPLLTEELGFTGDERRDDWDRSVGDAEKAATPVLVIGAGLSGLLMGYRLSQAGLPFTIIEKNDGPGGTWFENRYPGARVDVPSHCYSYSFTRDFAWPELFSPWPILRAYFAQASERFGLTPHIRYRAAVTRAVYDEASGEWDVTLRTDTSEERLRVRAIVSAVGQLNRPLIPEIANADAFRGQHFHTSRWPEGLDVERKKILVVGTAATALQLIPELAERGADVSVFQRSPTWVFVHPEYRNAIGAGQQWAIDHLPGYARWYRLILYNWAGDGAPAHMLIDPDWTEEGSISAANAAARDRLTRGMQAMIGEDPALLDQLIPKYPPYVKRPNLGDGGFFRAFSRPNVRLVTQGAQRFTETGLIDAEGVEHPADIVVYATGFRALEYLAPMEIVGRGGKRIDQYWGDEARAYLGITVPDFPNLFLMYGPGTNLGYNGNLFFNGECQARYIMGCLRWMVEDGLKSVDLRQPVYDDYAARMDKALAGFSWSHTGATNWYRNKSGKVISNSPWPLVQYWEWTRRPDRSDYRVEYSA